MRAAPLLSPDDLATLQQQVLRRNTTQRAAGAAPHAGALPTHHRGLGMELFESRPYRAGDDPRHVDWRATARHGRPITKVFRAERQRANFIVVDRSVSMAFGTRRQLKATLAAHVGAILLFSALADHETVGGLILSARPEIFLGGRSLDTTMPILRALSAALPLTDTVATPLDERTWTTLLQATTAGTHVYVISDFQHFVPASARTLAQLAATRAVTALLVVDPAEQELPDVGWLRIASPIAGVGGVINTHDATLRARYAEHRALERTVLLRTLRDAGVDTHVLSTTTDALSQLRVLPL